MKWEYIGEFVAEEHYELKNFQRTSPASGLRTECKEERTEAVKPIRRPLQLSRQEVIVVWARAA